MGTSKPQFVHDVGFGRLTSISSQRVAMGTSKSQFLPIGIGRSTSISCEQVAFHGAPAALPREEKEEREREKICRCEGEKVSICRYEGVKVDQIRRCEGEKV